MPLPFKQRVPSTALLPPSIYDGETRLLASWYFRLRSYEEASRSGRYGRPLALVVIEPVAAARATLREWLDGKLRSTDLACIDEDGRAYLLLPEAGPDAVAEFANRLLSDCTGVSMNSASLPAEFLRYETLLAPLIQKRRMAA